MRTSAQELQITDSANFIRVNVMIASPDYTRTQSVFGHMFLRMQCPTEELDYCFSFESAEAPNILSIFTGNYQVRLVCIETQEYITSYANEKRMIQSYPLNLTLQEGQILWERLDKICEMGAYPEHDYFHHGCSQELMNIITESVDGKIVYDENCLPDGKTINMLGPSALPKDHIVRLAPMLFSTDATDRQLIPGQRLFMPIWVPTYLKAASVIDRKGDSRPLLRDEGETFFAEIASVHKEGIPIWSWFLIGLLVVLIVSIAECLSHCPRWVSIGLDIFLLMIYLLMTCLLLGVYSISTLPTTSGWCWHFLVYNPILLVAVLVAAWGNLSKRTTRLTYGAVAAWLTLYMLTMAAIGDMLWISQYLMISAFALRCFSKIFKTKL